MTRETLGQANTKDTGSSETRREAFIALSPQKDNVFKSWFIGFSEGDGSFIINKDGYLVPLRGLKITQSSSDAQVLFFIKKNLGFGVVRPPTPLLAALILSARKSRGQDKNNKTHCFRVRDKEGLFKIISISVLPYSRSEWVRDPLQGTPFRGPPYPPPLRGQRGDNGNIFMDTRKIQFKSFIAAYNTVYKQSIVYIDNNYKPVLSDSWLCGFTDAEGCFTCSIIDRPKDGGLVSTPPPIAPWPSLRRQRGQRGGNGV